MEIKYLLKLLIIISLLIINKAVLAENNLAKKLAGRILLQVESKGQAWYVNPADQKIYNLGRPSEALILMRSISIGITNANLTKIPVGIINNPSTADDDSDGLPNNLEAAIGTNPNNSDSDQDGYNDLIEINNNYNPLGPKRLPIDNNFIKLNLGKIFLQIENNGEAWYVNPADQKRYFLGKPDDAFIIMKNLSLGITDENLNQIAIGRLTTSINIDNQNSEQLIKQPINNLNILEEAATGIRNNDIIKIKTLFSPNLEQLIDYTLNYLNADGRLTLANILSGATLTSSTADQKIYSNEVYFSLGGYEVPIKFYVERQSDGNWLIINL